ncbi:MAG: methylated-DNA--[protein]-cysteine S-methyltransferase [Anaerovoracaceae bacterium]|jgi:methylated-DNA-[protein]-cysteine S-methyltransferase
MQYTKHYDSPLGRILIAADDIGLTGLWFEGSKYFAEHLSAEHEEGEPPAIEEAMRWLDVYFTGRDPGKLPPLHMTGTDFQLSVWEILRGIPYGKTMTYGEIAEKIASARGLSRMSAQAVGGAVGHNGISIIIPCHRVIGADGSLTGYAGGIDRKKALLELEGAYTDAMHMPTKGTAL